MRAVILAVLAAAAPLARADDDPPATTPMHQVADDRAPCAELRADLGSEAGDAAAACARSVSRVVRGLGIVETWRASGEFGSRWALTIDTGRELWMSPLVDPGPSQCGAGHCVETDAVPSLEAIHPGRRAAVALVLDVTTTWRLLEQPGESTATAPRILTCGPDAAGQRRCATVALPDDRGRCTTSIADRGTVTRRCASSEPITP